MRTNVLQAQGFYLGSCSNSLEDLPAYISWRSGCYYLHDGECNLNQSKDDYFVERVAKNNS